MSNIDQAIKLIDQHAFRNKGVDELEQLKIMKTRFKVMKIITQINEAGKLTSAQEDIRDTLTEVMDIMYYQFQQSQNKSMVINDLKITNNMYKELLNKIGAENVELTSQLINEI